MESAEQTRLLRERYRLFQPIGRGGMGTVWRGTDEILGREVAVKEVVYPPSLPARERASQRERTLREARATARLSHASVVTVYDVVEEDGRPWIVMELVHGRTLAAVIADDGPLSPGRVARIGLDLLGALAAAHAAGVLHRDVKPGNVLLAEDGRVVLTDFGIAAVEGDPSLTSTGLVLGSPAYMAPERARGESPGPASDLWALGATLYAAVEGRPPYERESPLATLTALVTEEPDPPVLAGPLVPALDNLLRKDVVARGDVASVRALLRRAAASEPEPVPAPTGDVERTSPQTPAQDGGDGSVPEVPSAAPPAPTPAKQPPPPGPGGPPWRAVAAVVVLLLVFGAVVAWMVAGPDRRSSPAPAATGGSTSAGRADGSQTPGGDATKEPSTAAPSPAPSRTPQVALPQGFTRHEDPTGFSVAVPRSWDVVRDGSRVDFREPGGQRRFLRVDQTRQPSGSAEDAWRSAEDSFASSHDGYERLRLETVDYRGYDAADWEFTFRTGSGRTLHVLNRGMVTAPDRGYALYWSTPEDSWAASKDYLEVFERTFRPAS